MKRVWAKAQLIYSRYLCWRLFYVIYVQWASLLEADARNKCNSKKNVILRFVLVFFFSILKRWGLFFRAFVNNTNKMLISRIMTYLFYLFLPEIEKKFTCTFYHRFGTIFTSFTNSAAILFSLVFYMFPFT